jgi:hypothetical protein
VHGSLPKDLGNRGRRGTQMSLHSRARVVPESEVVMAQQAITPDGEQARTTLLWPGRGGRGAEKGAHGEPGPFPRLLEPISFTLQ